jgi:hypothetical protein
MRHISAVFLTTLSLSLNAQDVVIPSTHASLDGNGLGEAPGFTQRFRQQVVIAETALSGLVGRSIRELRFRRDGQYDKPLTGGRVNLTVRLSTLSQPVGATSPTFAYNQPAGTLVFQGTVVLPSSPALQTRNEPTWESPHAVVIPFTTYFAYAGGQLVIDLQGTPDPTVATSWWPVDVHYDGTRGSATTVGGACEPRSDLGVDPQRLVIGATARFVAGGPPAGVSILALASQRSSPIDLGIIGFPGCALHLAPNVMLTRPVSLGQNGSAGTANHELHWPDGSHFLDAGFALQTITVWTGQTNLRLATSPALDVTLAGRPSTLPAAVVTSVLLGASDAWPPTGQVQPVRVPVLRLSAQ